MKIIGVGKNLITQSRGDAKDLCRKIRRGGRYHSCEGVEPLRKVRDESFCGNAMVSLGLWSI